MTALEALRPRPKTPEQYAACRDDLIAALAPIRRAMARALATAIPRITIRHNGEMTVEHILPDAVQRELDKAQALMQEVTRSVCHQHGIELPE